MTVQILFKNNDNSNNQVLFVEENFNTNSIKKHVSSADLSYIKEILKNNDLKKKILSLDLNSKKRLILVSVKKKLESSDIENLGAELYNYVKSKNINKLSIILFKRFLSFDENAERTRTLRMRRSLDPSTFAFFGCLVLFRSY